MIKIFMKLDILICNQNFVLKFLYNYVIFIYMYRYKYFYVEKYF